MLSALKKYLLVPRLVWLSAGAPKERGVAWDRYWARVKATGAHGEVLWDSGGDHELLDYAGSLKQHLDPELPVLDIGCGNGTFTRWLAGNFPAAVGVDISSHAVERARSESTGITNVSFLTMDMTRPRAGSMVAVEAYAGSSGPHNSELPNPESHRAERPEVNVFLRGVLHVLDEADQAALARNIKDLVGIRGRVFLAETDFQGNAVDYVSHLGATLRSIPAPLESAIRGLPMPGHFGAPERRRTFPDSEWEVLEEGATFIETVPLKDASTPELIPGYYAALRARQG
jgi:SAM-dependent methyltransferase